MSDDYDVYRTPSANLVDQQVPVAFFDGSVSARTFTRAAWLTITYLVVQVPYIFVSTMSGFSEEGIYHNATLAFSVVSYLLWIYLLLVLKLLLRKRFGYEKANSIIHLSIALGIALTILSFFMDMKFETWSIANILFFAALIPTGIVSILLGKRLLSIEPSYRGMELSENSHGNQAASCYSSLLGVYPVIRSSVGPSLRREAARPYPHLPGSGRNGPYPYLRGSPLTR